MPSEEAPIIGPYHLGQVCASVSETLEDMGPMGFEVLGRRFQDEKLYSGCQVDFLGGSWDTTLSVTGGKIHAMLLHTMCSSDQAQLYCNMREQLSMEFGMPSSVSERKRRVWWAKEWGSITLRYRVIGELHGLHIIFISAEPTASMSWLSRIRFLARLLAHLLRQCCLTIDCSLSGRFCRSFIASYTDDEKGTWCLVRACEWGLWPLFLSIPVVPILLLFLPCLPVLVAVLLLTLAWCLIRYEIVSVTLARFGGYFGLLQWPASLSVGVYLLVRGDYWLAALAGLWPISAAALSTFMPRTRLGQIQEALAARIILYATLTGGALTVALRMRLGPLIDAMRRYKR